MSRYCLSAPASPLERQLELEAIVNTLEEWLPDTQVRVRIAEAIFEFERNITYQYEIFEGRYTYDNDGFSGSVALEAEAAFIDEINEMLMIDERAGGPDEYKMGSSLRLKVLSSGNIAKKIAITTRCCR